MYIEARWAGHRFSKTDVCVFMARNSSSDRRENRAATTTIHNKRSAADYSLFPGTRVLFLIRHVIGSPRTARSGGTGACCSQWELDEGREQCALHGSPLVDCEKKQYSNRNVCTPSCALLLGVPFWTPACLTRGETETTRAQAATPGAYLSDGRALLSPKSTPLNRKLDDRIASNKRAGGNFLLLLAHLFSSWLLVQAGILYSFFLLFSAALLLIVYPHEKNKPSARRPLLRNTPPGPLVLPSYSPRCNPAIARIHFQRTISLWLRGKSS
ncbi:hypothetical protein DL89DRAFT_176769 [Linderina pennispora]|uniref:Uncharacterized protein n=1 Tax=Linderina pennispora TaxID=61395 RepID=A0A1Y1VTA7_9FUNG|nr:uncharacterized protein DL89DRAFT_176769 [Linderina pennispora]ORX64530.1 hypothetical protein DL89DRAFT_176769 [Linderina pennispora]